MRYILTGFIKIRDVVDAPNKETAKALFTAKYPALLDKEAKITDVRVAKLSGAVSWEVAKKLPHDACGLTHPEDFQWRRSINDIYYPV